VKIQAICPQNAADFSDILTFKTACMVATNNLNSSKNALKIYPNPTSERVFFEFDKTIYSGNFDAQISDAAGRNVLIIKDLSENNLTVEALPTGVFQVVLRFENGRKLFGRVVVIR
jgi:hypothetical protein